MAQIDALTAQIRLSLSNQRTFGNKSEKADTIDVQMSLADFDINMFNEAEALKNEDPEPEIQEITSYKRRKTKGECEEDLSGLPVRIIPHTLSDEELAREFPDGYYELPAENYQRLFIIPETFIIDEHQVHIYKSKGADGRVLGADRPADLFRNSIATPALIASILNAKYVIHLPLERQSIQKKRCCFLIPILLLTGL